MTCHTVGFSTIQRNEVRDITATLLTDVCHNVATESPLQPLSREVLTIVRPTEKMVLTSTSEWEGFWTRAQDAFLNVRSFIPTQLVIIPWASRQPSTTMSNPLVISTSGRLGHEATTFYNHLADLISSKQRKHYSQVIGWLGCRLSFAIQHFAIMGVRDSRSSNHCPRC